MSWLDFVLYLYYKSSMRMLGLTMSDTVPSERGSETRNLPIVGHYVDQWGLRLLFSIKKHY